MYKLATYEADNVRQPATAAVMLSGFINGGAYLYGPQPSSKIAILCGQNTSDSGVKTNFSILFTGSSRSLDRIEEAGIWLG